MVSHEKLSAVLIDFAHTLVTDLPVQGILDRLVASTVDVLRVSAAGVSLISAGGVPAVAASSARMLEFQRLQTRLRQGPCLTAHDTGRPVSIPDLSVDDTFPAFGPAARAAGFSAVFSFPMSHGEDRLGALGLYRDSTGPLKPSDMAAAQMLADVAAAYLINAQARLDARDVSDRFQHDASHDALTGLPNRLMLEQRLVLAAQRGRRSHGTAAVLFVDVDRFKAVNDTHGHVVGDALLIAVAQRLSRIIRPGDLLARVSGDEFVVLCEDLTEPADAQILATRMQSSLAESFELGSARVRVTASVGIAYVGPGELVSDQLVRDADFAMYQVKRLGGASHRTFGDRALGGATPGVGPDPLDATPRMPAETGAR